MSAATRIARIEAERIAAGRDRRIVSPVVYTILAAVLSADSNVKSPRT